MQPGSECVFWLVSERSECECGECENPLKYFSLVETTLLCAENAQIHDKYEVKDE